MADVLTPEQRKKNMSHIKGKDTKPELIIRRKLFASGVRGYRVHYDLPGKPDIVFTKKKVVIFIDGCFWHKCPICFQEPETRKKFWVDKIDKIWEHHIRKNSDDVLKEIMTFLGRTNITDSSSSGGGGGYKYIRII
jgi:DNA mismatch endonuclease (patch repair protein)